MKKIMVVVAAVAMAAMANAASVAWNITGTAATENTTVYLLTSLAESYDNAAAITSSAVGYGTIAKSGRSYSTGLVTSAKPEITLESMQNAYLVIIAEDGKSYNYISADLSAKVYDPQNQETAPAVAFSQSAANILAGSSGTIGSVPEPTSGLLLLLGMAGLALRRKQK